MDKANSSKTELMVDTIFEEIDSFQAEFTSLVDSDNPSWTTTKFYFKRILKQFKLSGRYCEYYLVNEVYIRSIEYIREGGKIRNVEAWLKRVGLNVVRELSRSQNKTVYLETGTEVAVFEEDDPEIEAELKGKLQIANIAFQMLSEFDKELINLKITNGLSWKEVSNELRLRGQGDFSASALRKKKQRIMTKLRNNYHSIEASNSDCCIST